MNFFRRLFALLSFGLRRLPITTLLLLAAAGLFAARLTIPLFETSIDPRTYYPGALQRLLFVEHPEISGFFDLWRGEWWRILVSGLHHGSILHLLFNAMLIWSCGAVLEPRFGRFLYAFFLVSALFISALPEIAMESEFVGLSGVGYALFGALLMLRRVDPYIARIVTAQFVWMGFGWLFLCVPLTILKIAPIANGAHLGGILYGAFMGWQLFIVGRRRPLLTVLSIAMTHGMAAVAVMLAVSPERNGAYFSWKANESGGLQAELYWHRATSVDPHQVWAWKQQIRTAVFRKEWLRAWELSLSALKANRSDESLTEIARSLWNELESHSLSTDGRRAFDQAFGPEADHWWRRLFPPTSANGASSSRTYVPVDDAPVEPTIDVRLRIDDELPDIERSARLGLIQQLDEHQSALLGEST